MRGLLLLAAANAVTGWWAADATAAPGARGRFSIAPPPSWVERLDPPGPREKPPTGTADGLYYLLSDRQVRVEQGLTTSYGHYAKQILNEAGLESASQVSVDFRPAYQRLVFHAIRVLRAGQWTTRLRPGSVELIQRESGLESQVYDGTVSALVFVEDLRVGDVLDFSFTVVGGNPIFQGRYLDTFSTEWTVPLHLMRFRLLWPSRRQLFIRNHRTTLAPVTTARGAYTECTWRRDEPAPIAINASVPSWFDPYGWVQLSEFESWAEVVEWGRRLFEVPARLPPALAGDFWRAPQGPASDKILAALRFVQDEIRYVGIELGTASHQPSPPARVLARRFGDCKDKALLLCALLRQSGIDAQPALVDSRRGMALDEWQPSPLAFDHVVVRLTVDGRELWVDPTLTGQGGTLPNVFMPRYDRALVLAPGVEDLTTVSVPAPTRPAKVVEETYEVKGFDQPVQYRVTTRYEAQEAETVRRDLRERNRDQITREYVEYYARYWPGIAAAGAAQFVDDRESNVLVSTERYTIPRFWGAAAHKGIYEASLWAWAVGDAFETPPRTQRWAPLAISHPRHVRQVTRVELPESWDIPGESTSVADGPTRFGFRSASSGRTLTLQYDYRTLADAVPAAQMKAYLEALDRINGSLAFKLRRPSPAAVVARASVLGAVGMVGLLAAVALVVVYRRSASDATLPVRAPSRQGLRGWLLLFGAFLAALALVEACRLWQWRGDYAIASWMERTLPEGTEYSPLWSLLLVAVLLHAITVVAGAALLLALLARRRRLLRSAYPVAVAIWSVLLLVTALLAQQVPGRGTSVPFAFLQVALPIAAVFVWIPYLQLSDRARSTLTR